MRIFTHIQLLNSFLVRHFTYLTRLGKARTLREYSEI